MDGRLGAASMPRSWDHAGLDRTATLRALLWLLAGATSLVAVGLLTDPARAQRWLVTAAACQAVVLLAALLVRLGRAHAAGVCLVAGLWAAVTVVARTFNAA